MFSWPVLREMVRVARLFFSKNQSISIKTLLKYSNKKLWRSKFWQSQHYHFLQKKRKRKRKDLIHGVGCPQCYQTIWFFYIQIIFKKGSSKVTCRCPAKLVVTLSSTMKCPEQYWSHFLNKVIFDRGFFWLFPYVLIAEKYLSHGQKKNARVLTL